MLGIYSEGCGMKAMQAATLKYLVHRTSPEVISVSVLEAVSILNFAPLKS